MEPGDDFELTLLLENHSTFTLAIPDTLMIGALAISATDQYGHRYQIQNGVSQMIRLPGKIPVGGWIISRQRWNSRYLPWRSIPKPCTLVASYSGSGEIDDRQPLFMVDLAALANDRIWSGCITSNALTVPGHP